VSVFFALVLFVTFDFALFFVVPKPFVDSSGTLTDPSWQILGPTLYNTGILNIQRVLSS
jgi:hypothetical protein